LFGKSLLPRIKDLPKAKLCFGLRPNQSPDDSRKATTSWLCHDVGFAHMSDGRKATMSWRLCRHDAGFARMSSGRSPDDGRFATTSWLRHDQE
jgi:hypothetical protein